MGSRFKLSGQKKALLEKLLKEKGIGAAVAEGIPRRQPSDKAVLSFSQQRLWFLEQLNPGTSFYSLPNFLELQGTIDVPLLERCLNEIVQRHEILRTTFKTTQDQPIQQINDYQLLLFQIDRTGLSDQERIAAIKEFVQQETRHQFDLEKGPLFKATLLRFSDSDHVFCLNAHHIVFDGWSLNVLIQELTDLYTASDIGTASPLSDLSLQYADFAVWQQKWMQGETLDKQLAYWKNKLAGDLPPLELMVARPRKQHPSYQGATQSLELPILLTQQIRELAKQEGSTLFMVMLTALNVLLYRYSGQKDITVGTPIANRNRTEIEGLIGFFVNTLALRTNLSDQLSFRELLKQVRETTLGAYNHQDLPFDKLIEEIKPERNASYQPLFQVLFAFEQASKVSLEFSGITAKPLSVKSEFARFDLMVYVGESPESFTVFIEYSTDLFDDVTITRLLGHFQTLLTEIVDTPTQLVSKFNLLTPSEQTQLLKSSERFQTSTPDCFSQRFIRQVEKTPDAIAAVVQNEQITYRQLQHRVNQCSHILQTLDLGKDDVLGIYLQPGINLIVGLLGALQTGVTYVLTNPENSVAYTTSILQKQQVAAIITSRNLQSELSEGGFANVICLNSREADIKLDPGGSLVQPVSPEHPAAILDCIGRPVTINHRNINQLLEWLQQTVSLIDSDRVLCTFPFVGNAVIRDILWPLSQGSCVVLGHDYFSESSTSISLRQWMSASQVSVAHLLPSDISKLVSEGISSGLESLRYVLCSGEALHRNTVHKFYQQFNCDLAYFYQPSGVAIPIALQAEKLESEREFYPIGHPTTQGIYVLDSHLQPVPIGIQGDIYFADPEFVLSDKYEEGNSDIVNVTNLSQQSILPNSNALPIPDTSLLRTGDIGRWTSEETLDLCKTQQRHVWYRGGQVALSQIENLLLEMPDIEDCTVMLRQSNVHGQELVAYIVSSGKAVSEDMAEEYSNRLTTELPRIALPTSYISVSRIPLTREGELDESALANLEVIDTELRNQWQKQIQGMSDVDQVAVVLKDNHFNSPHLHLSDILPDWKVVIPSDEATHSDLPTGTQTSDRLDGELSINDGGPLPLETLPVQTLQDVLQRASQQATTGGILYLKEHDQQTTQSYAELLQDAQRSLAGLRAMGLTPGDKVIFQLDDNQQFITAFWGCLLGGFIPVPLSIASSYRESNSAIDKLYHAWQLLEKPVILTSERLAPDLETLPSLVAIHELRLAKIEQLLLAEPDRQCHPSQPDDLALMLLTSGSTGKPKAVMHTHRSLISHCAGDGAYTQFSASDVTLNWFPLDHVGGIVMFHLRDIYLGCQQIHAPTQRVLQDPLVWIDWLHQYRVTVTWAPNFAYSLVNDNADAMADKKWDLSSMRFILNAGEAIVAKTARRFLELLHPYGLASTAMRPAWGMSETSSAVVYSDTFSRESTTDEQTFVEVGGSIPGLMMRIVDADNQVVAAETIGRLQVKGDMVTLGYYAQPELTRQVLSEEGWFDTGDLGFLRQGNLTLTGRQKDLIIINGANLHNHEIETVVETVADVEVSFTAACAVRLQDSQTDQLAVFFHSKLIDPQALLKQLQEIRQTVGAQMGVNPTYLIPLDKADIPKTAIGKIQRTQLRKRLEAGEFDPIIKRIDVLSANDNTLPDWFYQRHWFPKQSRSAGKFTPNSSILVFMDTLGLGTALCQRLDQEGIPHIKVSNASQFEQFGPHHYGISLQQPQHYHQLVASLRSAGREVTTILHLGAYQTNPEALDSRKLLQDAQYHGTYSMLFLVQALAQDNDASSPMRLMAVTANLQAIDSNERTLCVHGTLTGLLHTLPLELEWLSCQHIDLPNLGDSDQHADLILDELTQPLVDTEIAYRQGQRWAAAFAPIEWQSMPRQAIAFKTGGMYLLTGGLGGMAIALARSILQHCPAKLILIGRTELPPRHEWPYHIENETEFAYKIRRLQGIEALTKDVVYHSADICDLDALEAIVTEAEQRWQHSLDGVLHLASEGKNLGEHWQEADQHLMTTESFETIEWMWNAKVYGSYVLGQQLLANRPDALFVGFSSVNALFGGATFGAYAAANSFLDHFCHYQRTHGHPNTYSINWSMWQATGMSQGASDSTVAISRQMGFHVLSKSQGWRSLQACLSSPPGQYVVGLDRHKPNIRKVCFSECETLHKMAAFFTVKDKLAIEHSQPLMVKLEQLTLHDRFSNVSRCSFLQVNELPRLANGQVDKSALQRLDLRSDQGQEDTAPQNPTEKKVSEIWSELLHVDIVGRHDNFFELGGHSLLATQMISHIRQHLNVDLSLFKIFELPTITALSNEIIKMKTVRKEDSSLMIKPSARKVYRRKVSPKG